MVWVFRDRERARVWVLSKIYFLSADPAGRDRSGAVEAQFYMNKVNCESKPRLCDTDLCRDLRLNFFDLKFFLILNL